MADPGEGPWGGGGGGGGGAPYFFGKKCIFFFEGPELSSQNSTLIVKRAPSLAEDLDPPLFTNCVRR